MTGLHPGHHGHVAVIGGGISGLTAAYHLQKDSPWDVTLFEARDRLGGHADTQTVSISGEPDVVVDTGFIVFNDRNYPNFRRLLRGLDISPHPTEMSFSVSLTEDGVRGGFEYNGASLAGLFVQRRNLIRPMHWLLLREIARFNREAKAWLRAGVESDLPTGQWLAARGFGQQMLSRYLLPMTGAIWSASPSRILDFPANSMLHFLDNHGLLDLANRPQWFSLRGGSQTYVQSLARACDARWVVGDPVQRVRRIQDGVVIERAGGASERFDGVVMACHADDALRLLDTPDRLEREVLGAFRYSENRVYLHSDPEFMPQRRAAWASWNYVGSGTSETAPIALSYWMNALQDLDTDRLMVVTLNPESAPRQIHRELVYRHPQFDVSASIAQRRRAALQGHRGVWYAGAHWRWGFHEDGVVSGITAVQSMGVDVPLLGEVEAA
jgi:hypothetical protein